MPTILHHPVLARLDPDLVGRWRAVPTSIVADLTRGRVLADPAIRALRPLPPGGRLTGRAVTALCEPPDFGSVLYAVAMAGAGDVVVIAAGGHLGTAMIGELLSGSARLKGVAGIACDGAVRDVATLAEWPDFPVFTRGVTPRGPSSKERGAVNGPVVFGGLSVSPGDLVLGDADGLVILSPADAAGLIDDAEARCAAETGWEARLAAGDSVVDVFAVPAGIPARDV